MGPTLSSTYVARKQEPWKPFYHALLPYYNSIVAAALAHAPTPTRSLRINMKASSEASEPFNILNMNHVFLMAQNAQQLVEQRNACLSDYSFGKKLPNSVCLCMKKLKCPMGL